MEREVARQVVEGSNGHPETEREVPEPLQECGTKVGGDPTQHSAICRWTGKGKSPSDSG